MSSWTWVASRRWLLRRIFCMPHRITADQQQNHLRLVVGTTRIWQHGETRSGERHLTVFRQLFLTGSAHEKKIRIYPVCKTVYCGIPETSNSVESLICVIWGRNMTAPRFNKICFEWKKIFIKYIFFTYISPKILLLFADFRKNIPGFTCSWRY